MPGKLYAPGRLDVLVGTTVTWQNVDRSTHTVTEDDDVFDSGHIRPGDSFSRDFPKSGTFRFHCTIHRFMRGTLSVFEVVLRGPSEPLPAGRRARLVGIAPAGAERVELVRLTPGPRAVVARFAPGADGTFAFAVRAPEPRRYRVHAGSATSPVVRVRVAPRVTIARRSSGIAVHAAPVTGGESRAPPEVRPRALCVRHGGARPSGRAFARDCRVPGDRFRACPRGRRRS